ncbi:amino acid adenylation domain-containing protein [Streptomyces sp. NPDC049837]|uniref:amino acid adenylation domain-containing protein n=1 Tax=Streptomyces sp. NPDC049837 TaxID=3155277 RepID=UPI00341CE1A0
MNSVVKSAWAEPVRLPCTGHGALTAAGTPDSPEPAAGEPLVPFPADALLHHAVVARATETPDAVGVIAPGRTLTYRELATESALLAHRLADAGTAPGSLVAVVMEKGWEQVVGCLGVLRAGAAYVPVDPHWPAARIAAVLAAAGIGQVLTQPGVRSTVAWPEGTEVFEVTAVTGPDVPADLPDGPDVTVSPDDLAYVIYTSGSTGVPKGVMIEHGPAVNTVRDVNDELSLTAEDRVLALSALHFDLSVYDIFGPLSAGGAVVIPAPGDEREPGNWLRLMTDSAVTVWNSVPALMAMLCAHVNGEQRPPSSLPPLRAVLMSGDWIPVSLPDEVRALFPSAVQWSLGGATEASIWSIWHRITPEDRHLTSIPYGTSMRDQRVFVADPLLRPRPYWVTGEICIAGAGVARGYLGDEERTRRSFVTDPAGGGRLYRTGDWGRLLPNGEIEFLGRRDDQVKIGGHRIELGDVEAALLSCPGVRAAVATVHGERGRTRLTAHVLLQPGVTRSGAALRGDLEQRLPTYMLPSAVSVRDTFPLTPNGKVDRAALAQLPDEAATDALDTAVPEGPADAEEQLLLDIWSDFFDVPDLSVTDNFFQLGGDSLRAVRLVSAIRRETATPMPVATLFARPTIRALAQWLRGAHEPEATTRKDATPA